MAATATTLDVGSATGRSTPEPARSYVPPEVRRRLSSRLPTDGVRAWWWAGLVGLIAAVLRLVSLAYPDKIIFDEVYYANEGESMLVHGSEWDLEKDRPKFVVHPPLGKWLIGLGILASRTVRGWFGSTAESAFDWRLASVVAGVVGVVLLVRVARRLFGSTVLGVVAGLLMSLDGMHFVSSRTALLDIFLMTFILAAFACLLIDRDTRRERWLAALERGHDPAKRPDLGLPWWRIAAAVLAGCALAVKWSAAWYILLFLVLLVVWEFGTQRSAGVPKAVRWNTDRLVTQASWVMLFGTLSFVTYVASWTGWFADDKAMFRHWLRDHGGTEWPILGAVYNLYEYHAQAYGFHTTLTTEHQYQSWPWQWLLLGRPVAYHWSDAGQCGAEKCAAEILLLGTPLLWWTFIPALIGVLWYALSRRDWRAWAVLATAGAGIVPWFAYQLDDRTMFYFYALPSLPFLVLAVTMVLGWLAGTSQAGTDPPALMRDVTRDRRTLGSIGMGAYIAAVAVCFGYFYPIYVGQTLSYDAWYARMWLGSLWI